MELQYLGDSTCVQAAGFEAGELTVQFQDNSIYTYHDVHPFYWYNFLRSTSKGFYFNRNIRNNFSFTEGMADNISYSSDYMKVMNDLLLE